MSARLERRDLKESARRLGTFGVVAVPFLFYYWTSAPGIGSSDTALIVDQMQRLDLSTHVNHHSLTLIVGWLFSFLPGGDPARLANLACVFLGGLAAALFYGLVYRRCRSTLIAAAATTGLVVSHAFWWHATVAEVYAMNAVLTVTALILLQSLQAAYGDRKLVALFFLAGLALFNHLQMGILSVAAAAYLLGHVLLARERGEPASPLRLTARCLGGWLLGFAPYAITFVFDAFRRGRLATAFSQALGGDFRSVMARGGFWDALVDLAYLLLLQFPSPFLLAVGLGVVLLARRWRGTPALLAVVVAFSLNTAFFAFYNTWDKFAFLLPSFIILAWAGSFGVEHVERWLKARGSRLAWSLAALVVVVCALAPPLLYARLVSLAPLGGVFARYDNAHQANVLDLAEYAANPNKRDYREFETYVRALFARIPSGAIYVDDDSRAYYPVRYFQRYRGWRRDVQAELVNSWGFSGWGLEPEEFGDLVRQAHRSGAPLFLVSIDDPFYGLITRLPGLDRLRYRRFPLDGERWVYRLVTAAEEGFLPPESPLSPRLVVGRPAGPGGVLVEQEAYGPRDPLVVALEFEPNGEPFGLRFRWHPPGGGTSFDSEEQYLPFGCTSAWALLDAPRPLAPGEWAAEAWVGEARVARTSFRVVAPSSEG